MPFSPHYRISFGGTLTEGAAPDEIWNCNINARDPETPPAHDFTEDTYLTEIQAGLSAWFSSADAGNSSKSRLTFVKCNLINAAGKYNSDDSHTFFYPGAGVAGGVTPLYPQIITTAISWGTARSRGVGAHGRIYPPNPTFDDPTTLEMGASEIAGLVTSGIALLRALANSANENVLVPVIASNVDGSLTDITLVKVGSVKDVQRRRKDALVEAYTVAPYVPTI